VVSSACWTCTISKILQAQRWLAAAMVCHAGVAEALHAAGSCSCACVSRSAHDCCAGAACAG
jgi:hypothetical protein